ncbi:MAG: Fe-S cluster assembly protein SufD [Pseudomonadota bacterium]
MSAPTEALIAALSAHATTQPRFSQLATDTLATVGFPTRRTERWKYTSAQPYRDFVTHALGVTARTDVDDAATLEAIRQWQQSIPAGGQLVFVDGVLHHIHTRIPTGARLTSTESQLGAAYTEDDALLLLNYALPGTAMTLHVESDTEVNLNVLHLTRHAGALAQIRLDVQVATGATLQLNETLNSMTCGMCNTVMNVALAARATCRHTRLQAAPETTLVATRIDATVAADARLETLTLDTGALLVRNDLNVRLAAPGAHVQMSGIYLLADKQHVDNHTHVDHAAENTTSVEDYRGVLRDASRAVFNGKVHVHEGADGTDASQANHNLLLSDQAEIDTKPELEIYADDVKCAHGATIGQLDEDALFYLRARGVPEAIATQLLTFAFCRAALTVDDPVVRVQAEALIEEQIPDFTGLETMV